jgi:3-hydroxyisobutyrate dehydrogenase-like beta-hydroxyacid dehydrogenase
VRRFDIPRSDFEMGRKGYNQWRKACREHHAKVLGEIMARHGYGADDIAEAQKLVRKQELKKDKLSQALENAVDVVFIEHYLQPFVDKYAEYDEDKLVDIIAKTLLKMSPKGHAAALALDLPDAHRALIKKAIAREKDRLETLAETALDW